MSSPTVLQQPMIALHIQPNSPGHNEHGGNGSIPPPQGSLLFQGCQSSGLYCRAFRALTHPRRCPNITIVLHVNFPIPIQQGFVCSASTMRLVICRWFILVVQIVALGRPKFGSSRRCLRRRRPGLGRSSVHLAPLDKGVEQRQCAGQDKLRGI